jgi:hypothetical protein
MSARSRRVGPGCSPSSTATTDVVAVPGGDREVEATEGLDHGRLGLGEVQAELGSAVQLSPEGDGVLHLRRRRLP